MTFNLAVLFKVMAILAVIVGVYLFFEEQLEVNLHSSKTRRRTSGKRSYILTGITGANFEDQLVEALLMISSALKAGRNLDQAFELVAVSMPAPICIEFQTLVQERRLGVPMVEALNNLAKRVPSPDLRLAVNATIFQQETGGNLEDLYKQIVTTVAERKRIRGKIIAGTAHARISGNLVGGLPIVAAGFVFFWHPTYMLPLLDNPLGQVVLLASIMSSLMGLFFINRMAKGIMPDSEDQMAVLNASKGKSFYWKLIKSVLRPIAIVNEHLGGGLLDRMREELRYLLGAAGNPHDISVNEFLALEELSAVIFILFVFFFLQPLKYGLLGIALIIVLLPLGFYLPRFYLTHLIRRRQKNIEYELPYMIDLLSLTIEAGLDLVGGIQKIVEKSRPTDVIVEFQNFLADVKFGKSLEEALTEMAERVQILSFFAFVSALVQAQRLGAEIGPTLRAQAEQMRRDRLIKAEERVNQLPVKLLIPLVFFVFPSIFVWLIGPSVIYIMRSFPSVMAP